MHDQIEFKYISDYMLLWKDLYSQACIKYNRL